LFTHLDQQNAFRQVRRIFVELHHWRKEMRPRFDPVLEVLIRHGFDYRIRSAEMFPSYPDWETFSDTSNMLIIQAWRE